MYCMVNAYESIWTTDIRHFDEGNLIYERLRPRM